ncbi:MAG TPA: bifunctional precorrin-2 dehydrogenase/sirohydrochlorin ferrochelatase [candidate division Zixibacteria bacterium]|nr:bifunctional precorrin-2 dehydrogenase/sirohydrochlorin ferrochelatase [candidate division Zixibacteria bacterium]
MGFYPIVLQLSGRRCLVIGGGAVAERKIAGLLEAGAVVAVVSPEVTPRIARWAEAGTVGLRARAYRRGDLSGYEIAFATTGDREVNAQIREEAVERGVWLNAADDPESCDFVLPSVLRRGDLVVAVSTGGGSPAFARAIREELERHFTSEHEILARVAAEVRRELRRRAIAPDYETWRRALGGEAKRLVARGDIAGARSLLLKELGAAGCD